MHLLRKRLLAFLFVSKAHTNKFYIFRQCTYSAPSVYRQNSRLSRFPPLKIPCYTAKLSYRHPPQVFRHKSRKTNLNSPVSTAHNYLLTAVYWLVIMECQDWSSYTVIDLIVEGRNRWVVLIRIITCKNCYLISCHKNIVLEEKA